MKRVLFLFFMISFMMISFMAAQSVTQTEITSELSHHLVSDEWGGVRVFRVEVGPHAATVLHRHRRDYVSVTLGDARILNEVEGKPPVDLKLNDGDTRFTPGNFAHTVKNLTDQPFRNVTIELPSEWKTRHAPSSRGKESGEETFPGGHIKTLFVRDGVRVSEINLDPGATVPNHRYDGRHLVVAISDLDLRSDIEGIDPMSLKFESGDARWLPGGYTNTGVRAARFVTLGF